MTTTQSTRLTAKRATIAALVGTMAGCSGSPARPQDRDGMVQVSSEPTNLDSRSTQELRHDFGGIAKQEELFAEASKLLEASTLSSDPQSRAHAYEALVQLPRVLTRVVGRGLVDENYGVRSIAAMSIGKAKIRGHEELLTLLLTDESPFVSTAAVFALTQTGNAVDRSQLAEHLFNEDNPGLRAHVAFLLGEMGEESALPLIKDAARASMPKVMSNRLRILELQLSEAMVKLGDESQLEPIRAALFPAQASDLEATALAIQALGELKDRSSRGTLALLAESAGPNGELMPPEILLAIAISMAKLGDENGWYLADMFWRSDRDVVRADSASVLGWTKRVEDLEKLERMLSDPSERVRVSAAAALVRRLK